MKSLLKKVRKDKKGFTLAELLVVVAIIGVLVAISIPIFTSQLEKSREAVDMANIRAKYAECQTALLTDGNLANVSGGCEITLKQTVDGWANDPNFSTNLGITVDGTPKAGGTATFSYTAPDTGKADSAANLKLTYSK